MDSGFWDLVESTLSFRLLASDVTHVPPHTEEPWRTLPCDVLVQNQGDPVAVVFRDGPPLSIPRGWGFFISANRTHYIPSDSPRWRTSRWAHLTYTVFGSVDLFELLPLCLRIPPEQAERLGDLCAEFTRLRSGPVGLGRSARIQRAGHEVLTLLSDLGDLQAPGLDHLRRFHRLAPVIGAITAHCDQPFTTKRLCGETGLSPSRLHALFREVTGLSPMQYVQRTRLSRAQYLLTVTDMKVSAVGAAVGIPDPYHFSRLFRRAVGVSPTTYRGQVTASMPVERTPDSTAT